jgi:hypothetical protein
MPSFCSCGILIGTSGSEGSARHSARGGEFHCGGERIQRLNRWFHPSSQMGMRTVARRHAPASHRIPIACSAHGFASRAQAGCNHRHRSERRVRQTKGTGGRVVESRAAGAAVVINSCAYWQPVIQASGQWTLWDDGIHAIHGELGYAPGHPSALA